MRYVWKSLTANGNVVDLDISLPDISCFSRPVQRYKTVEEADSALERFLERYSVEYDCGQFILVREF